MVRVGLCSAEEADERHGSAGLVNADMDEWLGIFGMSGADAEGYHWCIEESLNALGVGNRKVQGVSEFTNNGKRFHPK